MSPDETGQRTGVRAERAAATRRGIAEAARRLFARDGYGATTLRAIADEAGVAVQTVYAVYGSKAGILRTLREYAVDQPEAEALIHEAMRESDPARRLALFAASIRQRWERAGDIISTHNDAARTDTSVRRGQDQALATRRAGIAAVARSLESGLRPGLGVDRAAAVLDALTMPELHAELTGIHGWTHDDYEAWLAVTLTTQLLRS
ncbi:MAG: helix-turn-helix domain-containing protein [Dehalococcoidia bacterium]